MKKFLLLTCFLFATQASNGQITIQESSLSSLIGTEQTVTAFTLASNSASLQAIIDASGANQTWDFAAIPATDTFTVSQRYIGLPATLPGAGAAAFADADFAISVESDTAATYIYQGIEGGNHINYGTVIVGDIDDDGIDDELITLNSPPSLIDVFPIQFQDTWSDSTSTAIGGILTNSISITENEVDGWGTLVTPEGSVPALRINRSRRTYTPLAPQIQVETTQLTFVAASGISASILLDSNGSVITAEYSSLEGQAGTDIERVDEAIPDAFALSQNYPNPFNPSTRISFSIPEPSNVKLAIYTITGQEIASLTEGFYAAGTYEFSFDGSKLASGLYLYRLEAANFVQTRLMSLVK